VKLSGPNKLSRAVLGILLPCAMAQQQPAPGGVQQPVTGIPQQPVTGIPQQPGNIPQAGNAIDTLRPTYVLSSGDQIMLRAYQMEEISDRPYRIDSDGNISLPVLGAVHAGGLTVEQLEASLLVRLRAYVQNPQVTVNVVQYRSEPVFFVGVFRAPGIYPLQGRRTLVEMLTSIGGLQPNASHRIKVTRRTEYGPLPLSNATEGPDGKTTVAEISMGSLRENVNPAEDIVLQPFDVISVERAEMVYVNGEVNKVGGIELGERDSISLVQLITLSGGLGKDAAPEKALVLRPVLNTSRRAEIPVDLKKVLTGKASDFPLLPNDLLYVPRGHSTKTVLKTIAYVAIPLVPTIIYIVYR
jgi:polysaccharide biosynthesis/export protein